MIIFIIIGLILFVLFVLALEFVDFMFHGTQNNFIDYLIDKYKK